jgi:hypothetical protein
MGPSAKMHDDYCLKIKMRQLQYQQSVLNLQKLLIQIKKNYYTCK